MKFTAALIAGGKSTRMGYDKCLLDIDGEPLWQRQLHLLEAVNPAEILVSGAASGPWAGRVKIVQDAFSDAGPLAGVHAVLNAAAHEFVLVLAVDLPCMSSDFLLRLLDSTRAGRGAIPRQNDRFQPLVAIYPRACASLAEEALRATEFSLQKFCGAAVHAGFAAIVDVAVKEAPLLANVNTPANVRDALKIPGSVFLGYEAQASTMVLNPP
jgi:molybdenum cofactor guanylyltransferase